MSDHHNIQTIHQGRNVKRFREMLGLKQEGLAYQLGDDWNQKRISALEQREVVDDKLLQQIATALQVSVEAIKFFDEIVAATIIDNSAILSAQAEKTAPLKFNPIEKIIDLYEALLASEREKNLLLKNQIDSHKKQH